MDSLPDTETESTAESSSKSEEDDELDPRVQIELERLNHANEAINHLELQLDEARKSLKQFWDTAESELFRLEKNIGPSVAKARSYYDARIKLRDTKETLTKAKHRFECAQALHVAAKELAVISADYIDEAQKSNENAATWNETYRQAIVKAADAEREKYHSDLEQQGAERVYSEAEKLVEKLQKDFRRSINKSKPYYEMKAEYYKELDFQKRKVYGLENCVSEAKSQYQESLRNLERISNEIHEQRNQGKLRKELGERTSGVGEEQPSYTEPKPSMPVQTISSAISNRIHQSDELLRSCLLRTETLPAGIIAHTNDRYSPEGDESTPTTTTTTTDFNDQFILRPKQAPQASSDIKSEQDSDDTRGRLTSFSSQVSQLTDDTRGRLTSFSSQVSQITDDDDDKTGSLHVLSDEQLDHLAFVYHPYPAETDAIDELILQLQNSKLQAKTFFRNLFGTNSLEN